MYKIFENNETVPAEEFESLVEHLDANGINYIERKRWIGSLWQFGSTGAGCDLMVKSEADAIRARELITDFQKERISASRAEYLENRESNRLREMLGWACAIAVIALLLALSVSIAWW